MYPSPQVPTAVTDLAAVERGNRILVSFTIPPRTTDGLLLQSIDGIDLRVGWGPAPFPSKEWMNEATSRQIAAPNQPGPVTASIPLDALLGKTITLAERTMSGRRHYSAWSNPVTIAVQPPVAPPTDVIPRNGADGVELSWHSENATSFRIFRKADAEKTPALVGNSTTMSFTDRTSQFDTHYEYYVQALREQTESEVSRPASITPVDLFPPAVPSGVTAAPGINSIELSWERNTESDFRDYIVYRAVDGGSFEKLAETDSPVYSDRAVKSGTVYRYAISAVDQKGNPSAKSTPVQAIAP